jgi:hypothetical protein
MKSAGDILKSILSENQSEEAQEYYRFFSAWDEIIGENLAGRARAKELKGTTLIVEVDHPGWIQLLEMRQAKILHELRERFPALQIEKIRFYVAGEPSRPAASSPSPSSSRRGEARGSRGDESVPPGQAEEAEENSGRGREAERSEGTEASDTTEKDDRAGASDAGKNRLDSVLERLGRHIEGGKKEDGGEVSGGEEG